MSSAPDLGSTARVSRQDEQLVIRRLNDLGPLAGPQPRREVEQSRPHGRDQATHMDMELVLAARRVGARIVSAGPRGARSTT
jgi:hypothetical protein